MGNFFDIDYEQEYLVDFLDDMNERISEIEQISIKLDNSNGADPAIVSLIGAINTIKNNANETQVIPLASALDSLESILSIFAQKEVALPINFSRFIGCVFELAQEMAEQAAEMQKVDFDLFSKIQNSLQPLSQCDGNTIQDTISMAISFLSSSEDGGEADSSIDLFGDDSSDEIELFDEPEATAKENDIPVFVTYYGGEFFTPAYTQRSIEDLQAFRLLADEAASANNRNISLILTLARFLNAAAKNPVDASQLEAAVYLNEIRPTCPNKCAKTIAHMSIIPSSPGWELASSIVVFKDFKNPIEHTSNKGLESQLFNGAQILGLCLEFTKLTNFSTEKNITSEAKRKIAHMTDRFSVFWLKIFLRLVDKVMEYTNKTGPSAEKTTDISPKTILCLDDDEITLMVFDHMLKKAGHVPITVDNYDDALNIIQKNPPDLILLDLNMPGKGGYWLIEEKNNNAVLKGIPVAVISGSKEDYGIDTTQVIGIYEKPVSKDTMLEIISKACG